MYIYVIFQTLHHHVLLDLFISHNQYFVAFVEANDY